MICEVNITIIFTDYQNMHFDPGNRTFFSGKREGPPSTGGGVAPPRWGGVGGGTFFFNHGRLPLYQAVIIYL